MKIIDKNNKRYLIKDDNSEINISDGQYIKYTGIYYKNNYNLEDIETTFYGVIECCRYRHDLGITGIYIKPLYILLNNKMNLSEHLFLDKKLLSDMNVKENNLNASSSSIFVSENTFFKIINYDYPKEKYFLYPHLLMLPETYHYSKPLYFLDTVENITYISEDEHLYPFNEEKMVSL